MFAATLQEKVRLYQSRFNLLYQRLRRNALFAPTNPVRAAAAAAATSSSHMHSYHSFHSSSPGRLLVIYITRELCLRCYITI
jgi:hypothetical protein